MKFKTDNKVKKGFTLQNFSKKNLGGFTLIELLVVIAIIGILAGIVLVALGGARDRAKDARIQADMAQFRTQGEIIFSSADNYDDVDCAVGNIKTLCDDIDDQGGTKPSDGNPGVDIATSGSPVYEYCADVELNSGQFWCVDSELNSVQGACSTDPPFVCVGGGGNGGGGGGEYLVFVTSVYGTGDLSSWADAGGNTGLAAGDAICQSRADADPGGFGLGSAPWKAWLSDSTATAENRLNKQDSEIYLVDWTTKVADNWTDLVDCAGGCLDNAIKKKEDGNDFSINYGVFTGTETDGRLGLSHCSNWGSTTGFFGLSGGILITTSDWTAGSDIECGNNVFLYCFSQSKIAP